MPISIGAHHQCDQLYIEQTDLETGQVQRLSPPVTETSFSPGGLLTGQWYRFRVIPVNDEGEGIPSNPIEIRTGGFRGTYDHYYALGDSYSAGDGAPPYSGIQACTQSTKSYPYLLGNGVPTPVLLACTGAVTDDIDRTIQNSSLTATQLDQLKSSPTANSLITITIGGNDVGFSSKLQNCITSFHSCTSRQSIISQRITALEPRLAGVYQEIRQAAPGADILIVGYPLLIANPSIADCHNPIVYVAPEVTLGSSVLIRTLATQMDNVIKQAANQVGVTPATTVGRSGVRRP